LQKSKKKGRVDPKGMSYGKKKRMSTLLGPETMGPKQRTGNEV